MPYFIIYRPCIPRPWPSGRMVAFYAVDRGFDTLTRHAKDLKMVHAISLLSIQHFGKEHGSGTHSAARWPAPNCSIHCACLYSCVVQRLMKWRWAPSFSPKIMREGTLTFFDDICHLSESCIPFLAVYFRLSP